MKVIFNQKPVKYTDRYTDAYPDEAIENSFNLRQASLENAVRYGGCITRAAIDAMDLRFDRKHVIVDTRVSMLLPGASPSIPGWHTDGVPRGEELDPGGHGAPNLAAQVRGDISAPRYHLMVGGNYSAYPDFVMTPLELDLPDGDPDLYAEMTRQVNAAPAFSIGFPNNWQIVEFDWFNIHRAVPASFRGWRYLIRVTETDHIAPRVRLDDFIRPHGQVYLNEEFGW